MISESDLKFAIAQMEIFGFSDKEMKKCLSKLHRLARGVDQFVVMLHNSNTEWKADRGGDNCYKNFLYNLLAYDTAKFAAPEKLEYIEERVHDITVENFPGLADIDPEVYTTEDSASLEPKRYEVTIQNFPGLAEQKPRTKFDPGITRSLDE